MYKIKEVNNPSMHNIKQYIDILSQLTKTGSLDVNKVNDFLSKNKEIYWISNENNDVIGTGTMFIENKVIHNFGKVAHIEDVVIDNKYRGKGLGKILINFLTEKAITEKCYKIILDCNEKNKIFYEKCGFKSNGYNMSIYNEC